MVGKAYPVLRQVTLSGSEVEQPLPVVYMVEKISYGAATGNTVIIDNGVVNSTIMGGRSSDENVTDNTIIIDNAIVKGNVFGGNTNSGIATGNTVIVKGNSDISQTDLTGGYGRISSDNTLQFWSAGLSAQNIGRFQNLQFILPGTIGDGDILLT